MAWSDDFVGALLHSRKEPLWRITFTIWDDAPGGGGSRFYVINSHTGLNRVLGTSIRTGGQRVQPQTWRSTAGSWTAEIVGAIGGVLTNVTKGSIARLEMSLDRGNSWSWIAWGVVNQIRGSAPSWTLECWDIQTALANRLTTTASEMTLFYGVGTETTLAAHYTPTDGTISIASAAGFEKDSSTGVGLLKIVPGSGAPFYLEWSGTAGTTLTVGTVAVLGTTAIAASAGDTVKAVAYIRANPVDLARRVLVSTGAGTNGAHDVLPKSWGYAIPDEVMDHDDMTDWLTQVLVNNSGSTYVWDVVVEDPVEQGYAWLQNLLASAGAWLVIRQGLFAVRACQNHVDTAGRPPLQEWTMIRDEEIMAIEWEAWSADTPAEYALTKLYYGFAGTSFVATTGTTVSTLPGGDTMSRDQTGLHASSDTGFGDLHRLAIWDTDIGERVTLSLANWYAARLVPGDVIMFSTAFGYGAREALVDQAEFYQRIAMVTEVAPDWTGAGCRLGLALAPADVDLLP
jgi:hypothetical protein